MVQPTLVKVSTDSPFAIKTPWETDLDSESRGKGTCKGATVVSFAFERRPSYHTTVWCSSIVGDVTMSRSLGHVSMLRSTLERVSDAYYSRPNGKRCLSHSRA